MKIVFFSGHRDTFSNPTLLSLLEKLTSQKVEVVLFLYPQTVATPPHLSDLTILDLPHPFVKIPRHPKHVIPITKNYIKAYKFLRKEKIKHVYAIDQGGLICAGRMKKLIPKLELHYISFEILFADELHDEHFKLIKKKEIAYTKEVTSILIQDETRKKHLVAENQVSTTFKNWFIVPVAPSFTTPVKNPGLRSKLNISESAKVLVHTGSVSLWSGMGILIDAVKKGLPEGYVVVVHNRFPFEPGYQLHSELLSLSKQSNHLVLHEGEIANYQDLCNFIDSFDYGLALYVRQPHPYTGKNISEIGLASGKFSTYMMLDKPVLTTEMESFSSLNTSYNCLRAINNADDLIQMLESKALEEIPPGNCSRVYAEVLDSDQKLNEYINATCLRNQ